MLKNILWDQFVVHSAIAGIVPPSSTPQDVRAPKNFQGAGFFYVCGNTAPNRANEGQIMEYIDVAKELVTETGGKWGVLALADDKKISGKGHNWKIENETGGDAESAICFSVTKPPQENAWYTKMYNFLF